MATPLTAIENAPMTPRGECSPWPGSYLIALGTRAAPAVKPRAKQQQQQHAPAPAADDHTSLNLTSVTPLTESNGVHARYVVWELTDCSSFESECELPPRHILRLCRAHRGRSEPPRDDDKLRSRQYSTLPCCTQRLR